MEVSSAETALALKTLARVFGYSAFRGPQQEVVEHVIAGGDAIVLMPTGGGKSLCYQVPALVRPGMGIVVSPLIALMRDQVEALRQNGVRAAYWNSSLTGREARQVERSMLDGTLDILYVAPERLVMPTFLEHLDQVSISVIAVDEAHCVSQWGHDFRPEYRDLGFLANRFPNVPRMALTATADQQTRVDMAQQLRLDDARWFISGFDRPNIRYLIEPKSDGRKQLARFLDQHRNDAGIIYCGTRKAVDETAEWLHKQGRAALAYHAGMPSVERDQNQDRFLKGEGVVVVATVAFGMGIDKPNVRFVAHLDLPKSIEAYYQETGRAGRDGLPSIAWMLYGLGDVVRTRSMIESSGADETQKRVELAKLQALLGYCEAGECRRMVLLRYLGEKPTGPCGNCDVCLHPAETWDPTVAQKALAAVYRTGQRFGVQHLVDVLRGKPTERVLKFNHQQVKTFGLGKDIGDDAWRSAFRQLLAGGFISVDTEGFGGIRLTQHGDDVLRGREDLLLRKDIAVTPSRKSRAEPLGGKADRLRKSSAASSETGFGTLFHALRQLRMTIANAQGVPPYVVFNDRTLLELVEQMPDSEQAFLEISGIGPVKAQRYSEVFLRCIRTWREEQERPIGG